jgi:hypothetical protein
VSLYAFRDYCRAMADAPDVLPADAVLWVQLADEIDTYLGETLDDTGETDSLDLDLFVYSVPPPPPRTIKGRPIEDTPPL